MDERELATLYQLLDLDPEASPEEIQVAFRRRAYQLSRDGAEKELAALRLAYAKIKERMSPASSTSATSALSPEQVNGPEANGPEVNRLESGEAQPDPQVLSSAYPQFVEQQMLRGNVQPVAKLLNHYLNHPSYTQRLKCRRCQVEARLDQAQLQIHLKAEQVPPESIATALILELLQKLDLRPLQSLKIYGLRQGKGTKASPVVWSREAPLVAQAQATRYDRFSFNSVAVNACALPVAAILAPLLNASPLMWFLLPFQIWIHEFGHATIAWFSGRRALPLPIGWTSWFPERSLFVYFGLLFLLALLFHSGWKENLRWPMILAVGLALLQFWMTWFLPQETVEHWFSFGGVGGEFYLSTALMVCFYFQMPDRWRWDFCRFIVLVVAASAFWKNFWRWHLIKLGQEDIPWGTLLLGEGDSGGDMNRLVDDYGWTDVQIINTYNSLGNFCLLVLIGVYVIYLLKLNPQTWAAIQRKMIFWQAERR